MKHHYIQDHASLLQLCQQLNNSPVIAVDTEFVRTRTLYPKLGLIQLCNGEHLALIDPVAIDDLSTFWQLMTDENIVKVLHACSEDLEVFLTAANCRPVNVIDSQIIMSFLGHGLSMGYAAMIQHFTGVELDKSESRTDWIKRPLTDKQIEYAKADVDHLFKVYPELIKQVTDAGWLEAAQQETELMIDKKFTPIDGEQLYKKVKFAWRLSPKQLNLLKALTYWRFEQAKIKNQPIGFIAKDHTILALAHHDPDNVNAMARLEGVEYLDVKHKGRAMLSVLKKAKEVPESQYPRKVQRLDEYPGYKQTFKKIKDLLSLIAKESGLTTENLASKKQVNQFLSWHYKLNSTADIDSTIDILTGWRLPLIGDRLLALAKTNFR